MNDPHQTDSTPSPVAVTLQQASTTMPSLKGRLEAILFLTQTPLSLEALAEQTSASLEDTEEALLSLITDYSFREASALEIDDTDGYLLQIKPEYTPMVQHLVPTDLSTSVLRTLSVIALEGPIKQTDLIQLRGSSAYDHVRVLLQQDLIHRKRVDRSYQLTVSKSFYRYFQLSGDKQELKQQLSLAVNA